MTRILNPRVALLLAIAAALMLLLRPAPAGAQTPDTLVSNMGQAQHTSSGDFNFAHAQAFTTGPNITGYTLNSIEVELAPTGTIAATKVKAEVWSDLGGEPGAKSIELTTPSSITSGANAFTAPMSTTLLPNTTYQFIIYSTEDLGNNLLVRNTGTNNEDAGAAQGWSIADGSHYKGRGDFAGGTGSWLDFSGERKIDVKGSANSGATHTGTAGDLVSNTGRQSSNNANTNGDFGGKAHAQAFNTGTHGGYYGLTGVVVHLTGSATTSATFRAEIWSNSGETPRRPKEKLFDLTVPSSIAAGANTFAAPGGAMLEPRTRYWIVVYTTGDLSGLGVSRALANAEDSGGAAGWSIADTSFYTSANTPPTGGAASAWTNHANRGSVRIKVNGYALTPSALTLALSSDTVAEDGGRVTVTAALNVPAATTTSVTVTAASGSTATASDDYGALPTLSIGAGKSSATGAITIVDDMIDEDNETVILTTTVSGLTVTGVTLTITDNDDAGVTLGATSASTQVGESTTYTVRLNTKPTANVTITPTSSSTGTATSSGALTFTPDNWDRPQNVTVTGVMVGSATITHAASGDSKYASSLSIDSVSVTVSASTKTVTFATTTATVREGSTVNLTVTLGRNAPTGGVHVSFACSAGTVAAFTTGTCMSDDVTASTVGFTIPAGQNTRNFPLSTVADALVEGDETFTVTVSTDTTGWNVVSASDSVTVTIIDDDAANAKIGFGTSGRTTKYTISRAENVSGGAINVPVVVSHKPAATTTFAVSVEIGGTATEGTDYSIATKSVTFGPYSPDNKTQNLVITITNDALLEDNQTIELKISDGGSGAGNKGALYTRHAMGRLAQVTITDDDRTGAKVAFHASNAGSTLLYRASVDEDVTGGTLNVPVILNRIPEKSVTFAVSLPTVSTDAATEGTDFSIGTKSVMFGPSDTLTNGTVSKNIAITITDDSLVEEDQAIRLWIDDSATNNLGWHYARTNGGREARVTIEDDEADEAKIVIGTDSASTAESPVSATETDANFTVNVPVTISAKPESSITIPITVTGGTATANTDYIVSATTVTFGPGDTTQSMTTKTTKNLVVTVVGDQLVEEDQTIILRIGDTASGLGRHYTRNITSRQTTFTINDDERPGAKVAFHASNASITSKHTANVNETDGTIDVPVTITDLPESPTNFTVEVLAASTATEYAGTASVHEDFRVLANKQVSFGDTGTTTKNIRVQLNNNALVEHPETVELRIVAADSMSAGLNKHYARHAQGALATLTVADDDAANAKIAFGSVAASTMKFTANQREDVTTGTYSIPVRVSHSPSVETTFEIEVVSGGTATEGTDYTIGTKTFTISPTTTSNTVTVTITKDDWVEDDQTIEVRIKAADTSGTTLEKYYTRDANGSLGTITILDDEQRDADIAFGTATRTSRYTANGEEVVGTLNVPIAVNHLPESTTTIAVEVLSTGNARETDHPTNATGNPRDFTIGTKSVTFGPASAKSMNLAIAINNDNVEEDDETLDLRIVAKDSPVDDLGDHYDRGGSEETVGAGATARITIKSEDAVGTVTLTTAPMGQVGVQGGDVLLFEGQEMTVTATTDIPVGPGGWRVTLNLRPWRTSITASPNDVQLPTFTIPEGASSATGTVVVVKDTRAEQQELLHIGGNAKRKSRTLQVRPQWTRARITDSGAGITLNTAMLDLLPTEELTYTVRLNQEPTGDVTVTPASSATDKATVSGALTFTSTNYATPQPVTVTGVAAGSATITHTVTSTDNEYTNLVNLPSLTARVTAAATTFALVEKESGLSTVTAEEGETVVLELTADTIAPMGGTAFNAVWTVEPEPIVGTAGVTVSHTALTVTASGAGNTSTYTVRLNSQPTANVTIAANSGTASNATVTASRTFTTSNWATPQEFTVTGVATGTAMITHTATSADTSYEGATVGSVDVTVATAAVTPGGLALSTNAPMNRVNEGGSLLVIATLNQASVSGTTVTLTVDMSSTAETTDYTLPTTISIAAGKTSGWVTLTTRQDDDPDNETIVLTVASTGPTLTGTGLTVTIVDDERGVTVTVPEGKRRADASVTLPDDDAPTVGVKRIEVRASRQSWTARSGKGSVTISYTDDDGGEATIAFGNNAARTNVYQATVIEDVTGGTLTVPVIVSGAAAEPLAFTVRALPDSTAREASSATACTNGQGDFHIANKTVTIPVGATTEDLAITICDDALGEPDETIRLGFAPARTPARDVEDLFQRKPAGNLQAVITIDSEDVPTSVRLDNPNHPLAQSTANVREGQTVTVRATLDVPADQGGVTVTLVLDTTSATPHSTASDPAQPSDYTFPAPFVIPAGETTATAVIRLPTDQTVDGSKTLRFTATTNPSLTVTFSQNLFNFEIGISDIDTPGLLLSESIVTVAEGAGSQQGTSANYTVRLTTRPSAAVTVALQSEDESKATVSPESLTFTPQNWQAPQQVTVRAVARGSTRITHTAASTDGAYNNAAETLNVRVNAPTSNPTDPPPPRPTTPTTPTGDGDGPPDSRGEAELGISRQATVTVRPGSTTRYTIRLTVAPTADVMVTLSSAHPSRATVTPSPLTFTPQNWEAPQRVTVRGVAPGTTRINHNAASSDSVYDGQYRKVIVTVSSPGGGTPTTGGDVGPPTVGGGGPGGGGGGTGVGGGAGGGGGAAAVVNQPPRFDERPPVTRSVPENATGGDAVGDPVTATDPEGDALTYSLGGQDAKFSIDESTGQITVGTGAAFDYEEGRRTYVLVVTASDADGSGESRQLAVTVNVTDVQLPGKAGGYDANGDEKLDLGEVMSALRDYFGGRLTLEEMLDIARVYFTN